MDLWRSINKKLNVCLNGIRWALPKNTKLPLINGFSSHAILIPLISSHLISLLCPLNNKFPNLNTKKSITNSQISSGKKKKKINPLHGCYRRCAKKKKKKRLKESSVSLRNVLGKAKSRKE